MARKKSQARLAREYAARQIRRQCTADDAQARLDSPRQWTNHDPRNTGLLAAGVRLGYAKHDREFNEYRAMQRSTAHKVQRKVRHHREWVDALDGTRGQQGTLAKQAHA